MISIWIENKVIILNMGKHAVLTSKELSPNLGQDHVPPPPSQNPLIISEWTDVGPWGSPLTQ